MKRFIDIFDKIVSGLMSVTLICCVQLGCTKDSLPLGPETRTKVFIIEQAEDLETGTKIAETAGNNFAWNTGDKLKYYNLDDGGAVTSASVQSSAVNADGSSTTFDIKYTYPTDKELVSVFLGSNLENKTMSGLLKDRFTVEGGIPATQNGTLLPYMVSSARGSIETSTNLTLRHMQTYISFSLNAYRTVTGTFDKIVISDRNEDVNVAGDATYVFDETTGELSSCSISSGGSPTITISGAVTAGQVYYVAICPLNFTGGLRVTLYNGTTKLAYATTRIGNSLTPGKINNLGALDFNWIIPADATPVMTPATSSICNKGGWNMTKKLWCSFSPSDCSGVTWEIVMANDISTSSTTATETDPEIIASYYGTVTPGEKETLNGVTQFTALVTPKITEGWLLVKATLAGDEKRYATALVVVGDFIDIGGTVLWARSNLKGNAPNASLCDKTSDAGGYYKWGHLEEESLSALHSAADNFGYNRFGGTWSADGYSSYTGGKYSNADDDRYLNPEDDVCSASNSSWHIPILAEARELRPDIGNIVNVKVFDGIPMVTMGSTYVNQGFGDVEIRFPFAGCLYNTGGRYHPQSDMYVQTATLPTVDTSPYVGGTSYVLKKWTASYVLCLASTGTPMNRASGWQIRPVRSKEGWYPEIEIAP